ncbi:MAG: hypothetical protein BWY17_04937 [Deltaproteobacteria bacterium ADurb.Bin207]|nr:MAG: hypothetical protein BWY17_04937 [Deltaproteobacteria bacterium ADurb.Bin207]
MGHLTSHHACHSDSDGHLCSDSSQTGIPTAFGHPFSGAYHRLSSGVILPGSGNLLHVTSILLEVLVQFMLSSLSFCFGNSNTALCFGDFRLRFDEALFFFGVEVDIEVAHLQHPHPDVFEAWGSFHKALG